MTDDVTLLRKALSKYEEALRMKNMNQELLQHLGDSIFYLIKHTEKYNLPLPKKDELIRMVEKANSLIEQITKPTNRKFTERRSTSDLTEPRCLVLKYKFRVQSLSDCGCRLGIIS